MKSLQEENKSSIKALQTPIKDADLSKTASPQRRILFEPKKIIPSLIKGSLIRKFIFCTLNICIYNT